MGRALQLKICLCYEAVPESQRKPTQEATWYVLYGQTQGRHHLELTKECMSSKLRKMMPSRERFCTVGCWHTSSLTTS